MPLSQHDLRPVGPVHVVAATGQAAIASVVAAVAEKRAAVFAFCNAHTVNLARRNHRFVQALKPCVVFNDGIGLDLASRLLHGRPFPENLNGSDLTSRILAGLEEQDARLFLLGSPPGVAEKAAEVIAGRFPRLTVVGARNGFFDLADGSVTESIVAARPDVVIAAMGQPRQEYWATANVDRLGCPILCVGAYLDFLSGTMRRAPLPIQRIRMEWVYRLALEPRRLARRYLVGNPVFLAGVLLDRLRR